MLKFSLSWSQGRPKHRLLTELETALDLQRIRNGVWKGEDDRPGNVPCSIACRCYRMILMRVFVHLQTIFLLLQVLLSLIPLQATLLVPLQLLVMFLHHLNNLIIASLLLIHHPMPVVTVSQQ